MLRVVRGSLLVDGSSSFDVVSCSSFVVGGVLMVAGCCLYIVCLLRLFLFGLRLIVVH